jgi:hypothetical protein
VTELHLVHSPVCVYRSVTETSLIIIPQSKLSCNRNYHHYTVLSVSFQHFILPFFIPILCNLNTQLGSSGEEYDDDHTECLLTFIAQMDPKGWVWKMFGYQQASLQKVSRAACVSILIYFALPCFVAIYSKLMRTDISCVPEQKFLF